MGLHTVNVDDELWEEAMDAVGRGNLSQEIERFLAELAGRSSEYSDTDQPPPLLAHSGLTDKQQSVVRHIIQDEYDAITLQTFTKQVRSWGIYTRKDFIEKAWQRIDHDDYAPYRADGGVLEARQIQCYCGSKVYPVPLAKNDGRCPDCSVQLIRFDSDDTGVQVL